MIKALAEFVMYIALALNVINLGLGLIANDIKKIVAFGFLSVTVAILVAKYDQV